MKKLQEFYLLQSNGLQRCVGKYKLYSFVWKNSVRAVMNVMVCSRPFCAFQSRKTETAVIHFFQNSFQCILKGIRKIGRILWNKNRRGFAWAGVKRAQPS
jgi:hypothetical protein